VAALLERHQGLVTVGQAAAELGVPTTGQSQLTWRLLREAGWLPAARLTEERAVPVIERVLAEHGRAVPLAQVREALLESGLTIAPGKTARIIAAKKLRAVGPGTPGGTAEAAALESLRWDGLVTLTQGHPCQARRPHLAVRPGGCPGPQGWAARSR
jgi:hypothetical protein